MNNPSNKRPLSEESFESLRAPSRSREAKLETLTNIKSTIQKPKMRLLYPLSIAAAVLLFGLFLSPILLDTTSVGEDTPQEEPAINQAGNMDDIPMFIQERLAESLEKDIASLEIDDLTTVEHLHLYLEEKDMMKSSLTDLDSVAQMKNLKSLSISYIPTKDYLFLNELNSLEKLTISGVWEEHLVGLETMPGVTKLSLMDGKIENLGFLENFPNLSYLDLSANSISSLEGMEHLQDLTSLSLTANPLIMTSIYDVKPLTGLQSLTYLDIRDTKVEKVAPLAELPNLQILVANHSRISDMTALPESVIVSEEPLSGEFSEEERTTFIEIHQVKSDAINILGAMTFKDYAYLENHLYSTHSIDKQNNKLIMTTNHGEEIVNFIEIDDIEKLEFRFHDLSPDGTLTLGFAYYYEDTHLTIYFEFVQDAGEWKLYTLRTDA